MKQLTVFEMEEISGGYSWDFSSLSGAITSIVSNGAELAVSAAMGAATGFMIGPFLGYYAGKGGGVLGFGLIGLAGGLIVGGFVGTICGGIAAGMAGYDLTLQTLEKLANGVAKGTFTPWDG